MDIKINNIPFSLAGFKKMKKADFMKTYKSLKESNMLKKFKRYMFVLQARLHFAIRPHKRGFYDGLAASRGEKLPFGG